MVTLYHIMIVNQWFVFVNGFRDCNKYEVNIFLSEFLFYLSILNRWSELYFIFWYLFVTTIGLNICLALSGDVSI